MTEWKRKSLEQLEDLPNQLRTERACQASYTPKDDAHNVALWHIAHSLAVLADDAERRASA